MLSNEQRAHDIAIALIPTLMNSPLSPDELNGDGTVKRDVLVKYLETYNIALNALNREFK